LKGDRPLNCKVLIFGRLSSVANIATGEYLKLALLIVTSFAGILF
jgi:hypothetical protein|tara:strand:+ start:1841 stop:1975 length:135 start_codon:yes stop_codon:yes gene_type:complete